MSGLTDIPVFCRRRYVVAPTQIARLRFLVEGYDGLLSLSTSEPRTAMVELSWCQANGAEAEALLAALARELGMIPHPPADASI